MFCYGSLSRLRHPPSHIPYTFWLYLPCPWSCHCLPPKSSCPPHSSSKTQSNHHLVQETFHHHEDFDVWSSLMMLGLKPPTPNQHVKLEYKHILGMASQSRNCFILSSKWINKWMNPNILLLRNTNWQRIILGKTSFVQLSCKSPQNRINALFF